MLKREAEGGTEGEDGCGARAVGRGGRRGWVMGQRERERGEGTGWGEIYFTIKTGVQTSAEWDSRSPRGPSPHWVRRSGFRGRQQGWAGSSASGSVTVVPGPKEESHSLSFSVTLSVG